MDKERLRAAADKVFVDLAGAMTAGLCYVGATSGLFRAMAGKGPQRLEDVVRASGMQPRYVEEWLKGMACAGYLDYDPAVATFDLPPEHAYFLASDGSDHYVGGLFAMAPALLQAAPAVAAAFEQGGGVPFAEYGAHGVDALELINRGQYEHRFASYWLQALPDVVRRLEAGGRALDVGCGTGRVCVALATAFPDAKIVGIDTHAPSIERAQAAAAAARVEGRTHFQIQTTGEMARDAGFDLITACDCVHDFAQPEATPYLSRSTDC